MINYSLLVHKKYNALSTEQQLIFNDEFNRRKKSVSAAYLLWFVVGWHYAYIKKWGFLLLYIFSLGGFAIWAIVDLFRIPKMISDYNNNVAVEILRDITLMFEGTESLQSSPKLNRIENHSTVLNFDAKRKIDLSYVPVVLLALFVVFVSLGAFFKPDKIKIENQIVDKMLANNPAMVITVKNLLFGNELKEEHVVDFITKNLNKAGYSNIAVYEKDWIMVRKVEYVDVESNNKLINAFGFFGNTFVKLNYNDTNKIEWEQEQNQNNDVVEMVVTKSFSYLYSKNSFANNSESRKYRILELQKGDIVQVIDFGLLEGDMHKVQIIKGGSLYEGYVVNTAVDYLQ